MSLRKRSYLGEMTTSGSVPAVVKPFALVKKAFPAVLSGLDGILARRKKTQEAVIEALFQDGSTSAPHTLK